MRQVRSERLSAWVVAGLLCGCGDTPQVPAKPMEKVAVADVGYELRRLRPRDEEKLEAMFDRLRVQAVGEGKRVAVLFSADWCEPCRKLETELGNRHPAGQIGDVRIFELKEEDWKAATRMDEFDALRRRWSGDAGSYPFLVLLDEKGGKREEMKEAIARLETAGVEPTLAQWFASTRS